MKMSSMTIDQIKKSLTEQGVTLPGSRLKKADYVKLYKQHSSLNDSLGDVYSSDDDNPPSKTGSHSVSSSTSPGKIEKEVEQLTDDELYNRLKEFDPNIGPVLKNTRRVYEKKLMKILNEGKQSNGYDGIKTSSKKSVPSADEYSDSDVEIISQSLKAEGKGRKGSVLRESPKPSSSSISKTDVERPFSSNFEYSTTRSSTPSYSEKTSLTSRYSYIETVPKGSSYRYVEDELDDNFSDLRQRYTNQYDVDKFGSDKFSSDKYATNKTFDDDIYKQSVEKNQFRSSLGSHYKTGLGGGDKYKSALGLTSQYKSNLGIGNRYKPGGGGSGDHYTGTWEPNISRYLGTSTQKNVMPKSHNYSAFLKYLLLALLLFALVMAAIYLYNHWPAMDPYKMIEDDAERTIESLKEGSGEY